jgi:diketogulonate reductase-like aldo/keto reductase
MAYENEGEVGRVVRDSAVDREDIFLTTKVKGYPEYLDYESFLEAAKGCLQRLGTDYVDLLLVHWWVPQGDMEGVVRAMDELVDEGTVRNIGVSNFSVDELERAREFADAPILTNQVEYHPYFTDNQRDLLKYCQSEDIILTAYSPLAEGLVASDDTLAEIGARYDKSAAQVAIRWLIQQDDVVAIPKSASRQHMVENFDVFDFGLTDREMRRVTATRGPLSYELLKQGGPVYRFRGAVGPRVPEPVRKTITSLGSTALKFAP